MELDKEQVKKAKEELNKNLKKLDLRTRLKFMNELRKVPKKIKQKFKDVNMDLDVNKESYKKMVYEMNAKMMNKVFKEDKTAEQWMKELGKKKE